MIARFLLRMLPPWCVLALATYWALTYSSGALMLLGPVAVVELILWYQRLARAQVARALAEGRQGAGMERFLLNHPLAVCVGLIIFGVLIDLARAVIALGHLAWWGIGSPALLVNRQRYQAAKALRLLETADAVIAAAQSPAHVVAGASLRERALDVLRQPFGLRAEAPAPELPPAPVELVPVDVQFAQGVLVTHSDGTTNFQSMEAQR